ncbi:MAG: VWA domain-containing protein [Acidobacteriota bacterium]|nr:VWA domain-containing protein [Acidobacteriota bacterium]
MTATRILSGVVMACVMGALTLGAQQPAAPPEPQTPRPVFETQTEIVLVDVNVVDRDAKPVPTLTAADFELQVNGQPRPIQSVQFISTVPTNTSPATPRETGFSSNDTATTGRLLLFAVDEGNLRVASSRSVLRTAQSLFERLAPGDLVGLARLPLGVGNVEFTTDRKRVTDALLRVNGSLSNRVGMTKVNISEAWALETNDDSTWQQAIARECQGETGPGLDACAGTVEADARAMLIETSSRTRMTISALEGLLKGLAQLKTPINIVLISEGMFVARDRNNMREIGRRAAEARATIHVVRPGQSYFDVDDSSAPGVSRFFDDGLLAEGLEQLAEQTRGTLATVNAGATSAFERLGRELSGYYLLGFEPTEADRRGKEHRIRVQVKTRGLSVRARPTFVLRETEATRAEAVAAMTPLEQVADVLRQPMPSRALPMRVASYTSIDAASAKVRVVISAELGDPATTEKELPIGVIVVDKNDKAIFSRAGMTSLAPASVRGASPRLILTSLLLDPGEYTLRVAAIDDTGRAGSVHHTVNARLSRMGGGLNASDLMLVPQAPNGGELPRPRPTGLIDTETLTAMVEMSGSDTTLLGRSRATIEIADAVDGAALVSVEARQAMRSNNLRAFAATLRLGVLPPGEYIARAILKAPGQPELRLSRPFLLAPVAAATTEPAIDARVPLDPDAPPPPPAEVKIFAPVPRFVRDTVLVPNVVTPFLDGLASLHPPSPEVEAVIERARAGQFTPPDAPGATPDDELNLAFVRGLDALNKGQVPQAAAYFQQTLKGASDFLGAAFYLGATHAALGRDREAVGAWQVALLSENPGAVYPALVDALLRIGDGRQAADLLEEAPSAWARDTDRIRREATALAMIGDYSGALPKLVDLLDHTKNDDQPLLFIAIQVMYRMHVQDKGLSDNNLARFRNYVERHQSLGGPDRAIVETWRRYVLR